MLGNSDGTRTRGAATKREKLIERLEALQAWLNEPNDAALALQQLQTREAAGEPVSVIDGAALKDKLEVAAQENDLQPVADRLTQLVNHLRHGTPIAALQGDEASNGKAAHAETREPSRAFIPTVKPVAIPTGPDETAQASALEQPVITRTVAKAPPSLTIGDTDLHLIKGMTAEIAAKLWDNDIGSLREMSAWQREDVEDVAAALDIPKAQIAAQNWIEQATLLSAGTPTRFALTAEPFPGTFTAPSPVLEPQPNTAPTVQETNANGHETPVAADHSDVEPVVDTSREKPAMRRTSFADHGDAAAQAAAIVAEARARAHATSERVGLLPDGEMTTPPTADRPAGFTQVPLSETSADDPSPIADGHEASIAIVPRDPAETHTTDTAPAQPAIVAYKDALTGPRVNNTAAPTVDEASVRIVHRAEDGLVERLATSDAEMQQQPPPEPRKEGHQTTPPIAQSGDRDYAGYQSETTEASIRFVPSGTALETDENRHKSQACQAPGTSQPRTYDRYLGALTGSDTDKSRPKDDASKE